MIGMTSNYDIALANRQTRLIAIVAAMRPLWLVAIKRAPGGQEGPN